MSISFWRVAVLGLFLLTGSAFSTNAIYSDALLGWAKTSDMPTAAQAGALSLTESTFAWRFDVGYNHDISKNAGLGLEAGYGAYGSSKYVFSSGKGSYQQDALHFLIESIWHMSTADLMLKGGMVHRMESATGVTVHSLQKMSGEIQVGFLYPFNDHIGLYTMYDHLFGNSETSIPLVNVPRINMILSGLKITF